MNQFWEQGQFDYMEELTDAEEAMVATLLTKREQISDRIAKDAVNKEIEEAHRFFEARRRDAGFYLF